MSYDVRVVLPDGGTPEVELAEFSRGGTHLVGDGPVPASLNVTYNYGGAIRGAAAWLTLHRGTMVTKSPPPIHHGDASVGEARLNVRLSLWTVDGLRALHGQRLGGWRGSTHELWWLVQRLGGVDVTPSFVRKSGDGFADYWADTSDNVGHALAVLLGWSEQFPEATWEVA